MALRRYLDHILTSVMAGESLSETLNVVRSGASLTESEKRTLAVQIAILAILLVFPLSRLLSPAQAKASRTTIDLSGNEIEEDAARIKTIYLYPIKGCAPIEYDELELTYKGFELDRRWCFINANDGKKVNLKVEPRMVFIQPAFSRSRSVEEVLTLSISPNAGDRQTSATASTPARPSQAILSSWEALPADMYGDDVQGRVVGSAEGGQDPSRWASDFLGYEVKLVHFDRHAADKQRPAWPWYKPPAELARAAASAVKSGDQDQWISARERGAHVDREGPGKGVEFQDEYPLLVASSESMEAVQAQLADALEALITNPGTDGRGGRQFGGLDKTSALHHGHPLSIVRFRPNIVIESSKRRAKKLPPFSEDSWETLWCRDTSDPAGGATKTRIHLVARCQRCVMTTIDPVTAKFDDASVPLKLLSRSHAKDKKLKGFNAACFGMYAVPLPSHSSSSEYGKVRVGDTVDVLWRPFALDDEEHRPRSSM